MAEWAFKHRMGTLMLQSGELNTPQRMAYLEDVVGGWWGGWRLLLIGAGQLGAGCCRDAPPAGSASCPTTALLLRASLVQVKSVKERTIALDLEERAENPEARRPADATGQGLCVALSGGWEGRWRTGAGWMAWHSRHSFKACWLGLNDAGWACLRCLPSFTHAQAPSLPTHPTPDPARSGRAAAGALCAAARRGRRPLPAAHRELQPRAVRQHPPAGAEVGEPCAVPA